jgi:hypothetical protein
MKSKRSAHLHKQTAQDAKKKPSAEVSTGLPVQDDKKQQSDCNGCCPISWKPASVAR